MKIHYLNTDLELESPKDLTPIVKIFEDVLGQEVFNLYNSKVRGHFLATFEIMTVDAPDSVIQCFCMVAECLEDEAKTLWDGCYKKIFDIGYEGGVGYKSYTDEIRTETLKRVADLGACIRITVYPMSQDSGSAKL